MGVSGGCHCTVVRLDPRSTQQEELLAHGQFPNLVRQSQLDPAGNGDEFLHLGARMFHFQLRDPTAKAGLVGEVRDDPLGGIGF